MALLFVFSICVPPTLYPSQLGSNLWLHSEGRTCPRACLLCGFFPVLLGAKLERLWLTLVTSSPTSWVTLVSLSLLWPFLHPSPALGNLGVRRCDECVSCCRLQGDTCIPSWYLHVKRGHTPRYCEGGGARMAAGCRGYRGYEDPRERSGWEEENWWLCSQLPE